MREYFTADDLVEYIKKKQAPVEISVDNGIGDSTTVIAVARYDINNDVIILQEKELPDTEIILERMREIEEMIKNAEKPGCRNTRL